MSSYLQKNAIKVQQQSQETKEQQKIFDEIFSQSSNNECADCKAKSPQWASIDFGVLICMNCAGAHRTLSRQITRVRSLKLDNWTSDLLEIIQNIGNKIANDFFEQKVPTHYKKPSNESSLEDLIKYVQDKYIQRLFAPKGVKDPAMQFKNKEKSPPKSMCNDCSEPSYVLQMQNEKNLFKPLQMEMIQQKQQQQQPKTQKIQEIIDQNLIDLEHNDEFEEFQQATVAECQQNSTIHKQQQQNEEFLQFQTTDSKQNGINLFQVYNENQNSKQNQQINMQNFNQQYQKNYDAFNLLSNQQQSLQQMYFRQNFGNNNTNNNMGKRF